MEKGHIRFEKGYCKFCLLVKFQKPPKVGGLTMTEGSERLDVTVDRKHGGPPKVGDKSPKVGGPFQIGRYRFRKQTKQEIHGICGFQKYVC